MEAFNPFQRSDINQGVNVFRSTPGAILLDVRSEQEYREGHIPGSRNIPMRQLDKVEEVAENKDSALFVYCYSGARSGQAAALLRRMGYTDVRNIGGICAYFGTTDR